MKRYVLKQSVGIDGAGSCSQQDNTVLLTNSGLPEQARMSAINNFGASMQHLHFSSFFTSRFRHFTWVVRLSSPPPAKLSVPLWLQSRHAVHAVVRCSQLKKQPTTTKTKMRSTDKRRKTECMGKLCYCTVMAKRGVTPSLIGGRVICCARRRQNQRTGKRKHD